MLRGMREKRILPPNGEIPSAVSAGGEKKLAAVFDGTEKGFTFAFDNSVKS